MNKVNKQETSQMDNRAEPMSVTEWITTFLITMIPFVNIIMLLVWSLSDNININKRNWARAGFLMVGIVFAFAIVISFLSLFFR